MLITEFVLMISCQTSCLQTKGLHVKFWILYIKLNNIKNIKIIILRVIYFIQKPLCFVVTLLHESILNFLLMKHQTSPFYYLKLKLKCNYDTNESKKVKTRRNSKEQTKVLVWDSEHITFWQPKTNWHCQMGLLNEPLFTDSLN